MTTVIHRAAKTAILLGTMVLMIVSTSQAQWQRLGLAGGKVRKIVANGDYFYAATENGVYRKPISATDSSWTFKGLGGCDVKALLVFNADTILASIWAFNDSSLYRTTNGGTTWQLYQHGLGGGTGMPALALARLPGSNNILFASGPAFVARSVDGGLSWQVVWGAWDMLGMSMEMLAVDPHNSNVVWAGGENSLFSAVLLKSTNAGSSFQTVFDGGSENRCHSIAFHPTDPNKAWIGMEGQIIATTDGSHWAEVMFCNDYVYDVDVDQGRPWLLYGAGGYGNHSATIFISRDSGATWSTLRGPTAADVMVRDMLLRSSPDRNLLYLATDDGVYKFTDRLDTATCCVGTTGNFDDDPADTVDISDVSAIVDYLFSNGPAGSCPKENDVDKSGSIDIADLAMLVDFVFNSGTLPSCP